jgi:hypothetical protein
MPSCSLACLSTYSVHLKIDKSGYIWKSRRSEKISYKKTKERERGRDKDVLKKEKCILTKRKYILKEEKDILEKREGKIFIKRKNILRPKV